MPCQKWTLAAALIVCACTRARSLSGGDAGLAFSESTLSWSLAAGEQSTRSLTIASEIKGVPIEITSDQEWLTFSNSVGDAPLSTVITVDTMLLEPGDYAVVLSARQGDGTSTLEGHLTVGLPALRFSPSSSEVALNQQPVAGRATVTATRGAPQVSLTSSEPWLTAASDTLPALGVVEFTVVRADAPLGDSLGTLTAAADGYASATFTVRRTVSAPPQVLVLRLGDDSTLDLGTLEQGNGISIRSGMPIAVGVDCDSEEPPYDNCAITGLLDPAITGAVASPRHCTSAFGRTQSTTCVDDLDCSDNGTCEIFLVPPLHVPGGCAVSRVDPATPLRGTVSLVSGALALEPFNLWVEGYSAGCPACADPDGDGVNRCQGGRNSSRICRPLEPNYTGYPGYKPTALECLPSIDMGDMLKLPVPAMSVDASSADAVLVVSDDSPLRYPSYPEYGQVPCGRCNEDNRRPCLRDSDCSEGCTGALWGQEEGALLNSCPDGGGVRPNDTCQSVSLYEGVCSSGTRGRCALLPLTECGTDSDCIGLGPCVEEAIPCLPTIATGRVGSTLRAQNQIVSDAEIRLGSSFCAAPGQFSNLPGFSSYYALPGPARLQLELHIERLAQAPATHVLTVARAAGSEGGVITAQPQLIQACSADTCRTTILHGEALTLSDSIFPASYWRGANGSNDCALGHVTMLSDQTCVVGPPLAFADEAMALTRRAGRVGSASVTTTLSATGEGVAVFELTSSDEGWLTASYSGANETPTGMGNPKSITIDASSENLTPGTYVGTIRATADGYNPTSIVVTFVVTE